MQNGKPKKKKADLVGRETKESVATSLADAPKPKQQSLAGMEDRKIPDLHRAAEVYVEVRDSRIALTKSEVEWSGNVLELMKKHGKEKYICDGIEISVVHENEKVKVKKFDDEEEKED